MNNIQIYSKKKTIKDFSQLFAKMQLKNLSLIKQKALSVLNKIFNNVIDSGMKALVDKAFQG